MNHHRNYTHTHGKIPVELAVKLTHKDFGADIQHAVAIWAYIRVDGHYNYAPLDYLIDFVHEHTKRHKSTIRRWLKAGIEAGFFEQHEHKGQTYLFIIGYEKVYDRWLNGISPDHAIRVPVADLLVGSIQHLRAVLLQLLFAYKPRIMAHSTMANKIGRVTKTTRNYMARRPIAKQYVFQEQRFGNTPTIVQQLPNVWSSESKYQCYRANPQKPWDTKLSRYKVTNPKDLRNMKRYFRTEHDAQVAYRRRLSKGIYNPETFYPIPLPRGWTKRHQYMERYPAMPLKDMPEAMRDRVTRQIEASFEAVPQFPTLSDSAYAEVLLNPDLAFFLNEYNLPEPVVQESSAKPSSHANKTSFLARQYVKPFIVPKRHKLS